MRKALIATIVAAALFAVGAFAADFIVSAEDTASGTDPVITCTDNVTIDFTETFDNTLSDWYVQTITVSLDADNSCFGADLTLVIQDETGTEVLTEERLDIAGTDPIATTPININPDCTAVDADCAGTVGLNEVLMVSQVWNAAVLLDGIEITSTSA